jgi:hypothetical protein
MPIIINTKDLNPPSKFYFDDSNPKDGFILLRSIPSDEMKKITRLTEKNQPPEYRRGVRYPIPPKVNDDLRAELMWDWMIVSWEGLLDEKHKELPITKENKMMLMKSTGVSSFVTTCIEQLTSDMASIKKEDLKN